MNLVRRYQTRVDRVAWKRYWGPRGQSVHLTHGYLSEPYAGRFHSVNAHLSFFETHDDVRCMVALGDPALGKSWELERYAFELDTRIRENPAFSADALIGVDAPDFATAESLHQAFNVPAVASWREGAGTLYVVVDSLDEASFGVNAFFNALIQAIERLPLTRVRLRLGCRTAVFTDDHRRALSTLFSQIETENGQPIDGDGAERDDEHDALDDHDAQDVAAQVRRAYSPSFLELELAVLTKEAVKLMAAMKLGSAAAAEAFVAAVNAADVVPFAIRPQTLKALIARQLRGLPLNGTQAELYRELCEMLCAPDAARANANAARLSAQHRYRIAARICAALLFGKKRSVWMAVDPPTRTDTLFLADAAGVERMLGAHVPVDAAALYEALNTGLFTAGEINELVVHRAFAEFMAADWLITHGVSLTQLLSLLREPTDPSRDIVPALWEVAAWLSSMDESMFRHVAEHQPDILLWSEVVQLPVALRPRLIDAMFSATAANKARESSSREMAQRLSRLAHPALAAQLAAVIEEPQAAGRTRDLALEIARACRVAEVAHASATLALDGTAPRNLRISAARLVAACGSDDERRRLVPLVQNPPDDDVDDDVKGVALSACWRLLTPQELFDVLTPPRRPNAVGAYSWTLYEIGGELDEAYAREAASWLAAHRGQGISMESVVEAAFRLAVAAIDQPDVLRDLAEYMRVGLVQHRSVFDEFFGSAKERLSILFEPEEIRRKIVEKLVADGVDPNGLFYVTDYPPRLFRPTDVAWGIERLVAAPAASAQRPVWVRLLRDVFDHANEEHLQIAFDHRDDPSVNEVAQGLVRDFDNVVDARRHVLQQRRRQRAAMRRRQARAEARYAARAQRPAGPRLPRVERTSADYAEADANERWPRVVRELLIDESGAMQGYLTEDALRDLRSLRGSATGDALVEGATAYLASETIPDNPFPDGQEMWLVRYGMFAVIALVVLQDGAIDAVEDETWGKWARAIVPYSAVSDDEPFYEQALLKIKATAPAEARRRFVDAITTQIDGRRWMSETLLRVGITIPEVREDLSELLRQRRVGANATERLLGALLEADKPSAIELARELIDQPAPEAELEVRRADAADADRDDVDRPLAAQVALFLHAPDEAWDILQAVLAGDASARSLLQAAARRREVIPSTTVTSLSDERVAWLFERLIHLYPPSDDPWYVGVYSPGPRDFLIRWRQVLLDTLVRRNTQTAVDALETIARNHPEHDWLTQVWLEAKATLRGDEWRGVPPRDLMRLVANREARLVESDSELLDVIVESLTRFERDELHGEWRAVPSLWDHCDEGNTPKSEADLTNAIARHLRNDLRARGIIIGRELVLQTFIPGAAGGLRTDLDVRATVEGAPERSLRIVIEVKGSWNPEVPTAMEAQLVNDYLDPHRIRAGLYLVGYYTCAAWRADANGHVVSRRWGSLEALQERLRRQATTLSSPLRHVRTFVLDARLPDAQLR